MPAELRAAAALGGEMGRRLLALDWTGHPLGPPRTWSPSMRAAVANALASRFPIVLWLGEQLHLVYNDAYIPVLGDKHPAALGRPGADVWWDIWDVVGPMLHGVVATGVATWSDDLQLMFVNEGRRQERYFTFTYSPMIDRGGRIEGVFCAVTETTERVLGERRLQTLNALAAALMGTTSVPEVAAAAISVCASHEADLPFAAVYLPGEATAGGPASGGPAPGGPASGGPASGGAPAGGMPAGAAAGPRLLLATPGATGVLPADLTAFLDEPGAARDGLRRVADLPGRLPALAARFGEHCPEEALVLPLGEAGGGAPAAALVLGVNRYRPLDHQYQGFCRLVADQVASALGNARAYAAERERAEALAELDRAKTAFLANVSHEFRTPLTLMLGPLDEAIAALPAGDRRQRLEMVRRNGRRLVDSLLDFTRAEAGQARPALVAANIGPLTAGIAASFADLCRRAGIELRLDCRTAWAQLDPAMWETIVLNLVSNAFKHTSHGSITVRTGQTDGARVELAVTDTGTGIAPDHLPRLFDRFYRVPHPAARSAEGSGIGLALVRSLAEAQGGTVEVDSTPGQGTTVRIWLPAVPAAVEEQAAPEEPADAPGRAQAPGHAAAGTAANTPTAATPATPATARIGATASAYVDEARQWLGGAAAGDGTGDADPGEDSVAGDGGALDRGVQDRGLQDRGVQDRGGGPPERGVRPVIMVADDNADMRNYLAWVLGRRWEVLLAADGRAALGLIRRYHPDLLVTDVMMPGLDGLELVTAIRADPDLAHLPVIMLSARAGLEAAGEGLATGADHYLVKPFSSADLVNHVEARLRAAARDRAPARDDEAQRRRDLALAELGTALGDARSLPQVLQILLAAPLCSLGAPMAAVGVLDPLHGQVRIEYAGPVRPEVTDLYHLVDLDAPVPLADVIATDQRLVIPDTRRLGDRYAQAVADGAPVFRSAIVEPLHAEDGSVLGGLSLIWPHPRTFSPADLAVVTQASWLLARAVARIHVAEREHQLALSLQERLLDLGSGSSAAVVAAAYQSAAEAMRVGGDWYTATGVDERRIGVSVGDVVGHGLPAAAVMSQLRSALGAAALAAAEPAAVLDLLDRYARQLPGASFATVAYAIVNSAAGTVDYSCAGHLYPLIVTADGEVRYLTDGRRPPLAARRLAAPAASGHAALPPGSFLLMYTDGLIERRTESLDTGLARLASIAAECAGLPAAAVCDTLLHRLSPEPGYSDDVAMIVLRPVGSTPASHVDVLRATADDLKPARWRLRAWLDELGLPPAQKFNVLLTVGEALCNAIEHGNELDAERTVGLEVFAAERALTATVSDSGRWAKDSAASRREALGGRGLRLMHGLSDHVQTVRSTWGTRVTMTYQRPPAPLRPGS
jgi:signal transduction histidine kinase/CheY-like chemotaxis protein